MSHTNSNTAMNDVKADNSQSTEITNDNNNNNNNSNKKKSNRKAKRERNKAGRKKKGLDITNPTKILEAVFEKSTYKDFNLSKIVEKELLSTTEKQKQLYMDLKDVKYLPTVNFIDKDELNLSVLPYGFQGQVILPPTALLSLDCMYHRPTRVKHRWGKKKHSEQHEKKQKLELHRQYLRLEQQRCNPKLDTESVAMELDNSASSALKN